MIISGRRLFRFLTTILVLGSSQSMPATALDKPVLVELFTSEGCSSCPPAEKYLSRLRKTNSNIILIGEHVDYWNSLGWADPFSTAQWTERQQKYCQRLGANSCYTPQAVINGQFECIASNPSAVEDAISSAANSLSVPIELKVNKQIDNSVDISFKVGSSSRVKAVKLFLVEDGVLSHVRRGENGGRQLEHDGIVRAQAVVKDVKSGVATSASLPISTNGHLENFRVVALLEDNKGPFGAAQQTLSGSH
jgi:hypothetical protein